MHHILAIMAVVFSLPATLFAQQDVPIELSVQIGHTDNIAHVEFLPAGDSFYTVSHDGTVRVWDIATGKVLRRFGQHNEPGTMFAGLDGDDLYTADQIDIHRWNINSGERVDSFKPYIEKYKNRFFNLSTTPFGLGAGMPFNIGELRVSSGRVMVLEPDRQYAKIWSTDAADEPYAINVRSTDGHEAGDDPEPILSAALSADGKFIATSGIDGQIRIWNVKKAKEVEDFGLSASFGRQVAGGLLGGLAGGIAPGLESIVGEVTMGIEDVVTSAIRLQFISDDRVLSGHLNGQIAIYTVKGKRKALFEGVSSAVMDVRMSTDESQVLSGHMDGVARLWSVADKTVLQTFTGHTDAIRSVAYSPDGRYILTGGYDRTAILWDRTSGELLRRFGQTGVPFRVARFNDQSGQIYSGFPRDDFVRVWDLATGKLSRSLKLGARGVYDMAMSPDNQRLAVAMRSGEIKELDVTTGEQVASYVHDEFVERTIADSFAELSGIKKHAGALADDITGKNDTNGVGGVAWSTDGKKLASVAFGNGRIKIWDTATGSEIVQSDYRWGLSGPVDFSPVDSDFISFASGVAEGSGESGLKGLSFASNERTKGIYGAVEVWNMRTGDDLVLGKGFDFRSKGEVDDPKHRHRAAVYGVRFLPDGKRIVSVSGDHSIAIWDSEKDERLQTLRGHSGRIASVDISQDGKRLLTASWDQTVRLWDIESERNLATLTGHRGQVNSVEFIQGDSRAISASADGTIRLWDLANQQEIVSMIAIGNEDYVVTTPDNYYTASRKGVAEVAFRQGKATFPFEQYDLRLNRPDIVLQRIGLADSELITAYYRAYQKRLKRMGFSERQLSDDLNAPSVAILSDVPLSTFDRQLVFKVKGQDQKYDLARLNVYVNDVPIHGMAGLSVSGQSFERDVDVLLGTGSNKVQVSVLNEQGVESVRETFTVTLTEQGSQPDLHIVVVGVSDYQDPAIPDLDYPAKDAQDIANAFNNGAGQYQQVHVHTLLDQQASLANILALKQTLMETAVDDQVIVFFAGHGFLDENLDYYYASSDMELANPAQTGLPYDQLEGLLDGIPARQKLLLMDTCHAGEVDDDTVAPILLADGARGLSIEVKTKKVVVAKKASAVQLGGVFELMKSLFVNLNRGSGAQVISAAAGDEFAFENEQWQNGVFTYSLLQGLQDPATDLNEDGSIQVSELKAYVSRRVVELTNGQQTPTTRSENVEFDFVVR